MLINGGEIIFVRFIKIYIRDKIRNRMYLGIVLIGIGQVWSLEGGSLVAQSFRCLGCVFTFSQHLLIVVLLWSLFIVAFSLIFALS